MNPIIFSFNLLSFYTTYRYIRSLKHLSSLIFFNRVGPPVSMPIPDNNSKNRLKEKRNSHLEYCLLLKWDTLVDVLYFKETMEHFFNKTKS